MTMLDLAKLVKLAVKLREDSYDEVAASRTGLVDINSFYRKSLRQAVNEAALRFYGGRAFADTIFDRLVKAWDETNEWADFVIQHQEP